MGTAEADRRAALRALAGDATPGAALALFDELPPVRVESMLGAWTGSGLATGHPLDGLLELYGWHGKRFDGLDAAHALVFGDRRGLFEVNPAGVPLPLVVRFGDAFRDERLAAAARRLMRLRRTDKPTARLRMVEYRGVVTGTMSYDALPINDHFRTVDDDTLVGAMDARGLPVPFMFALRRGGGAPAAR